MYSQKCIFTLVDITMRNYAQYVYILNFLFFQIVIKNEYHKQS